MAFVHQEMSKYKASTLVVSIEEREKQKQSSSSYYCKNGLVKR